MIVLHKKMKHLSFIYIKYTIADEIHNKAPNNIYVSLIHIDMLSFVLGFIFAPL